MQLSGDLATWNTKLNPQHGGQTGTATDTLNHESYIPLDTQDEKDVSFLGLPLCSVCVSLCCHPTHSSNSVAPALAEKQAKTAAFYWRHTSVYGDLTPHLTHSVSLSIQLSVSQPSPSLSQLLSLPVPLGLVSHLPGNSEFI